MSTVLETQTMNDNIFKSFETLDHTDYEQLFNQIDSGQLYSMFINLCGEKRVTNICETLTNDELYQIIKSRYYENWLQVKSAISNNYDNFSPVDITETVTDEITANETTEGTNTNKTSVHGFNSPEAVESDEEINDRTNTVDSTQTRTNTKEKTGRNGAKSPATLLREEVETRKIVFVEEVLKDIKNYLTLDVY